MSEDGTGERKAFKDWFDRAAARALAAQVASVNSKFDQAGFVRIASRGLAKLEMMDRVRQFSRALREKLPQDVPAALTTLQKSLPPPLPDCESVTDGWLQWPVGQFIADYVVDHFEEAMDAMYELTQRFTAEFAVRPFVVRFPECTISQLLEWTQDSSPHVRRWCSEGVRPRLPWGARLRHLVKDPKPILPITEALRDDPEPYVRRSVANLLNDIAKDHPDQVIRIARRWNRGASEERAWTIRHALRTLVKAGHADALKLLGYGPPKALEVTLAVRPRRVAVGESIELVLTLHNPTRRNQPLLIDYEIEFVLARGKRGAKVFKWTQRELRGGETLELKKRHAMKNTTVRTLYPGKHTVRIQVNGHLVAEDEFDLAT